MFFFRKLFGLFFLGILILGLFGFLGRGGYGRNQSAYQQGFLAGQQAAAASNEASPEGAGGTITAAPNQPAYENVYSRGHGFFFPGFALFFCLIPIFLLGFFMIMGKRRWHGHRHHRGHWGHHRGGYGPWGQGPCGRHGEDWEDSPKEKSPDDIDDGPDEPIMRA